MYHIPYKSFSSYLPHDTRMCHLIPYLAIVASIWQYIFMAQIWQNSPKFGGFGWVWILQSGIFLPNSLINWQNLDSTGSEFWLMWLIGWHPWMRLMFAQLCSLIYSWLLARGFLLFSCWYIYIYMCVCYSSLRWWIH
jgi:hypothetical protein